MIFHDYGYSDHYMMNMEFGNWIYMILGVGVILIAIIVLTYILIHYNTQNDSINHLKNENYKNNEIGSTKTDDKDINLGNANFCHNCGKKLDDNLVKFCPYCGEEI